MNYLKTKKIISVLLSLSLCLGMLSTSAFAADNDLNQNVYVYLNVGEGTVVEGEAPEMPEFTPPDSSLKEKVEQAAEALEGAAAPEKFEPRDLTKPDKEEVGEKPEFTVDTETADPTAPEETGGEESAEPAAPEETGGEESTKPTDSEETGGEKSTEPTDSEETGEEKSTEPADSEETGGEKSSEPTEPAETDGEKSAEPSDPEGAGDDSDSEATGSNLQGIEAAKKEAEDAKAAAQKKLDDAKSKLDAEREKLAVKLEDAESQVEDANEAIEAANAKKTELDAALQDSLASLTAPEKPLAQDSYDSYDLYKAAVDEYNAKVKEYNAAREELQAKFEEAQAELNTLVETAQTQKTAAEQKVQKANEELAAFNQDVAEYNATEVEVPEAVKVYNAALKAYEQQVAEYNDKANEYNEAYAKYVEDYNKQVNDYNNDQSVKDYNEKVNAYNEAFEEYNKEFEKYKKAVEDYDEEALTWNRDKTGLNKSAVIDALLGESESLLDSKYASTEITVTKKQTDLFNEVNNGAKSISDLTEDEVDSYNAVVKAYNAAVDNYNENVKKDFVDLLKTDSRIAGQKGSSTPTDNEFNLWYTIGKITVGSVFKDNPSTIKGDSAGVDNGGNDYSSAVPGSDVYYWDKDENGEWTANPAGTNAEQNFEKHLNGGLAGFEDAFADAEMSYYNNGVTAENTKVDLSDVTIKWVLKISTGATNYQNEASKQPCWHLDGYLKVTQLARLAELQAVPTNEYQQEALIQEVEIQEDSVPLASAPEGDGSVATTLTKAAANPENWNATALGQMGQLSLNTLQIPDEAAEMTPEEPSMPEETDPTPEEPDPTPEEPDPTPEEPDPTPDDPTPTPPPVVTPSGDDDDDDRPTRPASTNPGGTTPTPTPAPVVTVPEEGVPLVEVPETPVPLAETPEKAPEEVEAINEAVPLAETPAAPEEVELSEEAVPLAAVPKTGDITAVWHLTAIASAAGLLVLTALKRKPRQAEES